MTYKQLYAVLTDPKTNQYFVGSCVEIINDLLYNYDLDFEEFDQLPEEEQEKEIHDANHVKMQATWYGVHLPKSEKDIAEDKEVKAKVAVLKAEAELKAKAEAERYQAGLEAVKSDPELLEVYNNYPTIRTKINNACHFCGAGVINSRDYFIGLTNK